MALLARWLGCAHNPRNRRFVAFCAFCSRRRHVPNVPAADLLSYPTPLELNAQKLNIAACAACAHKRATVSVAP
jgi:hypothetical protein